MSDRSPQTETSATGVEQRGEEDTTRSRDAYDADDDIDGTLETNAQHSSALPGADSSSDIDRGQQGREEKENKPDFVKSSVVLMWTVAGLIILYVTAGLLERGQAILEGRGWSWRGYQRIDNGGDVRGMYA